jgi:hypothetical protein
VSSRVFRAFFTIFQPWLAKFLRERPDTLSQARRLERSTTQAASSTGSRKALRGQALRAMIEVDFDCAPALEPL